MQAFLLVFAGGSFAANKFVKNPLHIFAVTVTLLSQRGERDFIFVKVRINRNSVLVVYITLGNVITHVLPHRVIDLGVTSRPCFALLWH